MKAFEVHPEDELVSYLNGKIKIANRTNVPIYNHLDKPTATTSDDFITVRINGSFKIVDTSIKSCEGLLMIVLYTRLNADETIKRSRINKLLQQLENNVNGLKTEHYFFRLNAPRPVTPPTASYSIGYSITAYNIKWHTI